MEIVKFYGLNMGPITPLFSVVLAPPIGFIDPIELAGLYEGDIVLPNNLKCPNSYCEDGKNAIIQEKEKWPGGVIPYFISAQFSKSTVQQEM